MKSKLMVHEQKEHGKRGFRCSPCKATTETHFKNEKHVESVHKFKCSYCEATIQTKLDLDMHVKTIHVRNRRLQHVSDKSQCVEMIMHQRDTIMYQPDGIMHQEDTMHQQNIIANDNVSTEGLLTKFKKH